MEQQLIENTDLIDRLAGDFKKLVPAETPEFCHLIYKKSLSGKKVGGQEGTGTNVDVSQRTGGVLTLLEESSPPGLQIITTPVAFETQAGVDKQPEVWLTHGLNNKGEKIIYLNFPCLQEDYEALTVDWSDSFMWSLTHNEYLRERLDGTTKKYAAMLNKPDLTDAEAMAEIWQRRSKVMQSFDRCNQTLAALIAGNTTAKHIDINTIALDQVVADTTTIGEHLDVFAMIATVDERSVYDHHSGMVPFPDDFMISCPVSNEYPDRLMPIHKEPSTVDYFTGMSQHDEATVHVGKGGDRHGVVRDDVKKVNLADNYALMGIETSQRIEAIQRGVDATAKRAVIKRDIQELCATIGVDKTNDLYDTAYLEKFIEQNQDNQDFAGVMSTLHVQQFINTTKEQDKTLVFFGGRAVPYKAPLQLIEQVAEFYDIAPDDQKESVHFLGLTGSTRHGTPGQLEYEAAVQDAFDDLIERRPELAEKIFYRNGQSYPPGVYANFMAQADGQMVGVLPGTQEGFGLQPIEAAVAYNPLGEQPKSNNRFIVSVGPQDVGVATPYEDGMYTCLNVYDLAKTLITALQDTDAGRRRKMSKVLSRAETIGSAHYTEVVTHHLAAMRATG